MSSDRSLVFQFDQLWKLTNTANQSCLEEFLRFATSQEECRLKWLETVKELQMVKKQLNEAKKENIELDSKLSTARKLLDQERSKRQRVDEERCKNERQLQMVRELLFADDRNHLHDETKEKLKFLNSTTQSRMSTNYNDRLSAIHELNSTGSILSDLSYSRSDEDFDVESVLRNKRNYVKHRPSVCYEEVPSAKRRRSHVVEFNNKDGPERVVATTTVTMEHDGSMSAQSQIEAIPPSVNVVASAPERAASLESVESGLSLEKNTGYNQGLPKEVGVLPIGSNFLHLRSHTFATKTVIRPEDCDVCDKRIKFGNTVLRCHDCRASCHPQCKENLPLPCIAPGSTPISKKNMGVIADYAPSMPPMVPALVVHCINEIESRGLNEHGIYRVPGSDKDVKALKEKFMRGRGVPRLADIDIHVICGCLKDFLRSLKEPLVTHALWWQFAEAAEIRDIEERRAKLYQAISQLPQANRDTLAHLILHLLRVAETKETNKMPISNLATVLGPTVIGYSADYNVIETYSQTSKARLVLEQLLAIPADYWYRIMSAPLLTATPRAMEPPRSFRTPSTRNFKKLFDTPSHSRL